MIPEINVAIPLEPQSKHDQNRDGRNPSLIFDVWWINAKPKMS